MKILTEKGDDIYLKPLYNGVRILFLHPVSRMLQRKRNIK